MFGPEYVEKSIRKCLNKQKCNIEKRIFMNDDREEK